MVALVFGTVTEAVELNAEAREPLIALAALLVDQERFADALDLVETPLERHPRWARLQVLRGVALEAAGRTPDAIRALERAVQEDIDDHQARTLLGILYQRQDRTREALEQYAAVLGSDDEQPKWVPLTLVLEWTEQHRVEETPTGEGLQLLSRLFERIAAVRETSESTLDSLFDSDA